MSKFKLIKQSTSFQSSKPFVKLSPEVKQKSESQKIVLNEEQPDEAPSQETFDPKFKHLSLKDKLLAIVSQKPVIQSQKEIMYLCQNGVKLRLSNDKFWETVLLSINSNLPNLGKKTKVTTINHLTELYFQNLKPELKAKILEAVKNLINTSKQDLDKFPIEHICTIVRANNKLNIGKDLNLIAFKAVTSSLRETQSSHEFMAFLQTHYKFFKNFTDPQLVTNFNQMLVNDSRRYLEKKTLKNHEYAYILNYLVQQAKGLNPQVATDIINSYVMQLTTFPALQFQIEDAIFILQSLSKVQWQKEMLLHYKTKCLDYMIECLTVIQQDQSFTSLQVVTLMQAISTFKASSIIDMRLDSSHSFSIRIQELQELFALKAIDRIPEKDYGFLFLILNTLKNSISKHLIYQDVFCQRIQQLIEEKGKLYIDGRILNLLGNLGARQVEFWLYLEKVYEEQILQKDEIYKVIEGLVGLAMVSRGSISFIIKMQETVEKHGVSKLKPIDIARAFYAVSLISPNKVHQPFLESLKQEINQRLAKNQLHFKLIDLITILQSFANLQTSGPYVQQLILNQSKDFNNRYVISLFEIYAKMDAFDAELRKVIVAYFMDNYKTFAIEQFSQIVKVLKLKDEGNVLNELSEKVINDEQLKNDSLTLKQMLKTLQRD